MSYKELVEQKIRENPSISFDEKETLIKKWYHIVEVYEKEGKDSAQSSIFKESEEIVKEFESLREMIKKEYFRGGKDADNK